MGGMSPPVFRARVIRLFSSNSYSWIIVVIDVTINRIKPLPLLPPVAQAHAQTLSLLLLLPLHSLHLLLPPLPLFLQVLVGQTERGSSGREIWVGGGV